MHLVQRHRQRSARRDRGSMLVIALGVLALLSILAITFVSLMKLELLASKNYVDGVKARLIAEGGMEEAITELKQRGGLDGVSNPNDDWVYADGKYWLPLEEATTKRDKANAADWANRASFVGTLGGTYVKKGDRFKIQVIDTQCQFNLNNVFDGLSIDAKDRESNVYCRQLSALGEAIRQFNPIAKKYNIDPIKDARYPANNPKYFGPEAILAFRQSLEGKLFNSKYQLTEILPTEQHYKILRDYVTTKSWMDPKSTVAYNHDGTNEAFTDVFVPKPVPGELPVQRAPLNVNLASEEVLTANLAGLCGRSTFMYFGDRSKTGTLQQIDEGTPYAFSLRPEFKEELEYSSFPVIVYFNPMGYRPGSTTNDPPYIEGANAVAKLIMARRKTPVSTGSTGIGQGPFKSFSDWERWVDQNITDDFLQTTKDGSGNVAFPQPDTAPMFNAKDHTPLSGTPSVGDVRKSPRFRPWFFDCVRSIIKANMNPNGRGSMLNPNSAAYLDLDKGNLLYPRNMGVPTAAKYNSQTCEWCFGSRGIFEIISLGEILALDKVAPYDPTTPPLDEKNPIAQAKVLTVVQIFDQIIHTSQRDFERNGQPMSATGVTGPAAKGGFGDEKNQLPPGNGLRYAMISYPFPKQLWDPRVGTWDPTNLPNPSDGDRNLALQQGGPEVGWHAHDDSGYLELAPRITLKGKPNDTSVTKFGQILFSLLWQDKRVRVPKDPYPNDSFIASVANKVEQNTTPGDGCPTSGDPTTAFAMPSPFLGNAAASGIAGSGQSGPAEMYQKLLNPDGFLVNELRNLPLWYRACDKYSVQGPGSPNGWPPNGAYQGDSIATGEGNVWATPTGGVEFWFKPEFDWFVRKKQYGSGGGDPGIGFVPSTTGGGDATDERYCGFLAVTAATFNDVATHWTAPNDGGPDGYRRPTRGTQMFVSRTTAGDLRITRLYYEVIAESGNELPWVTDIEPGKGPNPKLKPIRLKDYMDKATTNQEYTWPPYELLNIPQPWHDIKYARLDAWIQAPEFKNWRAHEWHHVGSRWDDKAGTIEIFVDGVQKTPITHELGAHYQAVVNTPTNPAPVGGPYVTQDNPGILRLNQNSTSPILQFRRPKDQIHVGSIYRPQAKVGGLFKFDKDPSIAMNGTMDDLRFYDGVQQFTGTGQANRFEEDGIWTQEFDLSDRFAPGNDFLDLGNIQFTAYLPYFFGGEKLGTGGGGTINVSFKIVKDDGSTITYTPWTADFTDNTNSSPAFKLVDPTGRPAIAARGDRLIYTVKMTPAQDSRGFAVASPVLDDISLVYFLPTARVLLKERMFE